MSPTRSRARPIRFASIATISLLALAPVSAYAQSAEAEKRFNEGEALLAAGKVAEACGAFEESNRLEPRAGTLINLGLCEEKLGKLASALAAYQGALERVKDPNKKEIATERISALEPRVSRLTIAVGKEARIDGLAVSRDGKRIDADDYGQPVPVDGGSYKIAASAPGHRRWSKTVEVEPEGARASVTVPVLAEDKPAPPVETAPVQPEQPAGKGDYRTVIKVAGYGLLGVGIASMGYVFYATVSGPIPDYAARSTQPLDNAGMQRPATSGDCDNPLGQELRNGANKFNSSNVAFDKACSAVKTRAIFGVVGLIAVPLGVVSLYLAYRGGGAPAARQSALARRRRGLAVTPLIGPAGAGAMLRFAW